MSFAAVVSPLKHQPSRHGRWLAAAAALAALAAPARAQGTLTLPLDARTKGSAKAPVTVYEMADFQCPVCHTFVTDNFPLLEKEYVATGKVRWIFINFPLPSIHANAVAAAEFASCAGKQGKFWPTHDMLYSTQDSWEHLKDPVPFFQSRMTSVGVKAVEMNGCLESGAGRAMVQDDAAGAARAGATATPTFYIEGGLMVGLYPLETFRHVLDSIYTAKTTMAAKKP